MKKLIILAMTIALLFTGCGGTNAETNTDTRTFKTLYSEWRYSIICDAETGVEYIVYKGGYAGGITPRLDADGNVVVLHEVEQK